MSGEALFLCPDNVYVPNMPHRSIPQNVADDMVFPIRVKVVVPPHGLGIGLLEILRWLQRELGDGNFARHEAEVLENEALALYFRRITDAAAFLENFSHLELADGTTSRAFRVLARPTRLSSR